MDLFNGVITMERNTYFFKWVFQIQIGDYTFRLNRYRHNHGPSAYEEMARVCEEPT